MRVLDEHLGSGDIIAQHPGDLRRGRNTQLPLADLLRQSVHSRTAGYENVAAAERLSQDPKFRLICSQQIKERGAALISRLPGNLRGRLVLLQEVEKWSLISMQQRLAKTGGRLIEQVCCYWLLLAESHLTRRLFGATVSTIASPPVAVG